ncbi:MAG: hypothetical protein ACRCTE_14095 [Cellulosilyticaceae bacterium]
MNQDITEATNTLVAPSYLPYGSKPTIVPFLLDEQPATLIYPSTDQILPYQEKEVTLVAQYPEPIIIDNTPYNYLIIWSDPNHMSMIIKNFKFLKN